MQIKGQSTSKVLSRGFSLVEVLITLLIIGIMAALGIAAFGGSRDSFTDIQAKRNAQEIVSAYIVAAVAGVDFTVPGDRDATIQRVVEGQTAPDGVFAGKRFGVFGLAPTEVEASSVFIRQADDGMLVFAP